ncbi:hypothetical protein LCGC14_1270020 [marine sediment metagenome]|uniref:Uncharacterized protein n=1 Tax=marine sediment metagenome TaxID=412755 RepID=A0A0F9P1H8_9ZZZZ
MTIVGPRKVKGGAVDPVGLYGAEIDIERWLPIRVSEDGLLRVDIHDVATPGVHKFGSNPDIRTGTVPEDIWDGGGVYPGFIAAALPCEILSDDPNDDDGDTGANTVEVQGLGDDGNMRSVIATMDGVNPVAIGTFFRIFRLIVLTAGASDGNEGTITARTIAGPVTMAQILPFVGQSLMAIFTTSNDFSKAHMVELIAELRANTAQAVAGTIILQARPTGGAWQTKEILEVHSYGGEVILNLAHAPEYMPLTDLRMRAIAVSSAGGLVVSGGFDLKCVERIIPS